MKTIGYYDKGQNRKGIIKAYFKAGQTRHERIESALTELQHMGNITVYLIKGNKTRKLFSKGF